MGLNHGRLTNEAGAAIGSASTHPRAVWFACAIPPGLGWNPYKGPSKLIFRHRSDCSGLFCMRIFGDTLTNLADHQYLRRLPC